MSTLSTFCWPCAEKLGLRDTLLPALSLRPCAGCGGTVGFEPGEEFYVSGRGTVRMLGAKVRDYSHQWTNHLWPVAWGIAMQDNYGTHVHEWDRTSWSAAQDGKLEVSRWTCRCGAKKEKMKS